jgi:hypothetical protein
MNKRILATMFSMTLLPAVTAFAQGSEVLRATIPFEFRVGPTMLPAGDYDVRPETVPGVLSVRNAHTRSGAMILTIAAGGGPTARDHAVLVFNRYDRTYFLSQVLLPGYAQGREIMPSKAERELARDHAKPTPLTVALARQR